MHAISTLVLIREFTNRREFIRPGIIRFATTFLGKTSYRQEVTIGCYVSSKKRDDNIRLRIEREVDQSYNLF